MHLTATTVHFDDLITHVCRSMSCVRTERLFPQRETVHVLAEHCMHQGGKLGGRHFFFLRGMAQKEEDETVRPIW